MTANDRQVAGDHYSRHGDLQHWDVVLHLGLDYLRGNFTKYLFRWRDKNGVQDLEKAAHYLDKFIEQWENAPWTFRWFGKSFGGIRCIEYDPVFFARIANHFDLDSRQTDIVKAVVYADNIVVLEFAALQIQEYISQVRNTSGRK